MTAKGIKITFKRFKVIPNISAVIFSLIDYSETKSLGRV